MSDKKRLHFVYGLYLLSYVSMVLLPITWWVAKRFSKDGYEENTVAQYLFIIHGSLGAIKLAIAAAVILFIAFFIYPWDYIGGTGFFVALWYFVWVGYRIGRGYYALLTDQLLPIDGSDDE